MRDPDGLLDFLKQLKGLGNEDITKGLFSLINKLITTCQEDNMIKARMFAVSLMFYTDERLKVEDEILRRTMIILSHRPDSDQTLGLARYVFINEDDIFATSEQELINLNLANLGIIDLMYSTFHLFGVDQQIQRLIPRSLHALNPPFIQILKEDHGLNLIRSFHPSCKGNIVKICALVNSPDVQALRSLLQKNRQYFVQSWELLDQEDMVFLFEGLAAELEQRNKFWIGRPQLVEELIANVCDLNINKGLRGLKLIIAQCLKGDFSKLNTMYEKPMIKENMSPDQLQKAVKMLQQLNPSNKDILPICSSLSTNEYHKDDVLLRLEELLGYSYHPLQELCLHYLLQTKETRTFTYFGIGNGKTLLCATIALLIAKLRAIPVIVVCKNDPLTIRDQKKYLQLFLQMGVPINVNAIGQTKGVYYCSMNFLKTQMESEELEAICRNCLVVIDEYDWVLFDSTTSSMHKNIEMFQKFGQIIGISGSLMNQLEEQVLKASFSSHSIRFPTLAEVEGDMKIHLADVLVSSSLDEFCKQLETLIVASCKRSPTIIVAGSAYSSIEAFLKKKKSFTFYSLRNLKSDKINSLIDEVFTMKDQMDSYGVYLLTEAMGRGTDFFTTAQIEADGGNYLIIADVFSTRSEEQIVGRVGRLGRKGRWHYVLFQKNERLKCSSFIQLRQREIEISEHLRKSALFSMLSSKTVEDENNKHYKNRSSDVATVPCLDTTIKEVADETCDKALTDSATTNTSQKLENKFGPQSESVLSQDNPKSTVTLEDELPIHTEWGTSDGLGNELSKEADNEQFTLTEEEKLELQNLIKLGLLKKKRVKKQQEKVPQRRTESPEMGAHGLERNNDLLSQPRDRGLHSSQIHAESQSQRDTELLHENPDSGLAPARKRFKQSLEGEVRGDSF